MTGLTIEQRVGMRIRAMRASTGLTHAELAAKVGMSRASLVNIEAGRQGISLGKLAALALVLHLDLNDLIREDDLPEPDHKVTIRRCYEVDCRTCGCVLDAPATRVEAVEVQLEHITAMRGKAQPS